MTLRPLDVRPEVQKVLESFVETLRRNRGSDLSLIVLYGSAAEGRLRRTSDINVIVVLRRFDRDTINPVREAVRTAYAAVRLTAMFLLEDEMASAVDAFAVKFADIMHRRKVLFGEDPFSKLRPHREAEKARLKQVLLNLTLRLRQNYVMHSLRDEQITKTLAETAGPLRACAATLVRLQGGPTEPPKESLERWVTKHGGHNWDDIPSNLTRSRHERALSTDVSSATLIKIIEVLRAMQGEVETLV